MPRSKNARQRRTVLAELREVNTLLAWLKRTWNVQTTIYVPQENRAPGSNAYLRERLDGEYPENRAEDWAHLYNSADQMIDHLTGLRETARQRYHEITAAEADTSRGDA